MAEDKDNSSEQVEILHYIQEKQNQDSGNVIVDTIKPPPKLPDKQDNNDDNSG